MSRLHDVLSRLHATCWSPPSPHKCVFELVDADPRHPETDTSHSIHIQSGTCTCSASQISSRPRALVELTSLVISLTITHNGDIHIYCGNDVGGGSLSWRPRTFKTTPRQLIHHLSPSLFAPSQSFSLTMAGYHNPLPYAVGVIPAMCNHQAPVSLRVPEITSTWTGKDIPIEDASTGLPMFFVSGKGTSWSGRKRVCT
jgi:hypothetical protein